MCMWPKYVVSIFGSNKKGVKKDDVVNRLNTPMTCLHFAEMFFGIILQSRRLKELQKPREIKRRKIIQKSFC